MQADPIEVVADPAMIEHPVALLAVLLSVLAVIFWLAQHPATQRFFRIVPALVFCYFVPTALTTAEIIPDKSELYTWIKTFLLPASLLLLILALDVRGIIRLGPKAVIMLLAGTAGVVVGAPIALLIFQGMLPADIWQGMTALAGSWIGGGANYFALGDVAGASAEMMGIMVIPDVLIANIWMGVLLYLSGRQDAVDRWMKADNSAIRDLERRMTEYQQRVARTPSVGDLLMILALAFGGSWLSYYWGDQIGTAISAAAQADDSSVWATVNRILPGATWRYILVTAVGVVLSFTPMRKLDGAGASKLGSVMIYLLVACIGASASFERIAEQKWLVVACCVWMFFHILFLLVVARLIRAPLFFVAVGSQANIGGAASAPVVAAAFHPSLAPVGALLAVAGYVLGTYAGLACMQMLKWASTA